MPTCVLRLRTVLERTGYSRSGLYARIAAGLFPRPIPLGARAAAWPEHEIDAVIAALIRTIGDDDLRTLVDGLHSRRSTFGLGGDSGVVGGAAVASSPTPKPHALRRAG
ncbi:helix-turn-helix transcriptional regulator [Thiocapsa roseopersicina]|uniref:Transcriptional regulator, AlpA family n=1 Tax=Thiocapsa roseopersicina TaxID=1058 RepID=A0A1H2ZY89_THIRO|nr:MULTISPECIES: AlpA family phage regulatory protein [Thiocapsa]CRI63844.1 Putative transcriptional regulator (modular protein) [Thiocapsa sp. KS1]SDX21908.1 transcriptional regulator, AlpA family [Thiocapsa roseopersicina]